ncbi:MAG TPA: ABC transporter substrate-binding protein, partial [Phototrophicaceae bacterium]|nr:ABC transporter substrate-binding protein [Phototrophicaceae bacterium]
MIRKFSILLLIVILGLLSASMPTVQAQSETKADGVFPVTIEHKFGSTTIIEAPKRVVAIGFTEQDLLLAVGITPVAVRYWYGDETNAIFPWAQDKVEGENPIVLNMNFGELNYEAILALQPDLISAVTSGITQEEYDLLSQIAPTIAQSSDYINFGMPWQAATQMVGDAVGKSATAEVAVTEVEDLFADARAQYPEFEGKTVAVAYYSEGTYGFYTAQDSRGRFFTDLGFVVPDELVEIAGESFYANVSAERIDLLDQDLIAILNLQFIEGGREALEADPLFGTLKAAQEGRVIYFDEQAENALGFSSPLSLPYALNAALPQLEAIFGGSSTPDDLTPEASAASDTTCEAGFRLFDHEYLAGDPVCIPENPQRILALEFSALESVLLADKELVGTANWLHEEVPVLLPELAPALEGIADTGYPTNLEAALLAAPDLIL